VNGANTLHPLEITDARKAAHRASEVQRQVENDLRRASRDAAEAERVYRQALAKKILELRAEDDPPAWSVCGDLARGDRVVARAKFELAVAEGIREAVSQQAFRRGADRRDLDTLLTWSMRRDLRTDTPPPDFERAGGRAA
jgi:hypothetical protein